MDKVICKALDFFKKMDLTDLILVKICVCAFGILLGTSVKKKKAVGMMAFVAFIVALIPLWQKFFAPEKMAVKKVIDIEEDIVE